MCGGPANEIPSLMFAKMEETEAVTKRFGCT